jgi:hypothetical protein
MRVHGASKLAGIALIGALAWLPAQAGATTIEATSAPRTLGVADSTSSEVAPTSKSRWCPIWRFTDYKRWLRECQ